MSAARVNEQVCIQDDDAKGPCNDDCEAHVRQLHTKMVRGSLSRHTVVDHSFCRVLQT